MGGSLGRADSKGAKVGAGIERFVSPKSGRRGDFSAVGATAYWSTNQRASQRNRRGRKALPREGGVSDIKPKVPIKTSWRSWVMRITSLRDMRYFRSGESGAR